MKKEHKKLIYKIAKRLFLIIFIGFTALYFSQATGYYEYYLHEKVVLNEDKIKKFEQDIKDGKNIDIEDYISEEKNDYSNQVSSLGLSLSKKIGTLFKDGFNTFFDYVSKMVEE